MAKLTETCQKLKKQQIKSLKSLDKYALFLFRFLNNTFKGEQLIMKALQDIIREYLEYCLTQKRLDKKTIKAYRIDLTQFANHLSTMPASQTTPDILENYISTLHNDYKPKTVKRKIASLKALFHYMEYKELIELNPFNKIQIRFREPIILPRTIPLNIVEVFLSTIYKQYETAKTPYQKRTSLRNIAISELLFATGIRVSELCSLKNSDINLYDGTILIYGKGAKERRIQIGNEDVLNILRKYHAEFYMEIMNSQYFFTNQSGNAVSDQAIRRMIQKYSSLAGIELHITPHMFRHTFATSLLEADVDIRYIQEMLGHSSINITEIYTHVATAKQRDILTTKHPRNKFQI